VTAAELRADHARLALEDTAHRVAIGAETTGALLTATERYTEALLDLDDIEATADVAAFVAVAVMAGATRYTPVEAAPDDREVERLRDILDRHPATVALADAMRDALDRLDALDDDDIAAALGLDRHPNAQQPPDPDDRYDADEPQS
jgi:pyruvate dehydrogenase complex dehydrogenase (E1) component